MRVSVVAHPILPGLRDHQFLIEFPVVKRASRSSASRTSQSDSPLWEALLERRDADVQSGSASESQEAYDRGVPGGGDP